MPCVHRSFPASVSMGRRRAEVGTGERIKRKELQGPSAEGIRPRGIRGQAPLGGERSRLGRCRLRRSVSRCPLPLAFVCRGIGCRRSSCPATSTRDPIPRLARVHAIY